MLRGLFGGQNTFAPSVFDICGDRNELFLLQQGNEFEDRGGGCNIGLQHNGLNENCAIWIRFLAIDDPLEQLLGGLVDLVVACFGGGLIDKLSQADPCIFRHYGTYPARYPMKCWDR